MFSYDEAIRSEQQLGVIQDLENLRGKIERKISRLLIVVCDNEISSINISDFDARVLGTVTGQSFRTYFVVFKMVSAKEK